MRPFNIFYCSWVGLTTYCNLFENSVTGTSRFSHQLVNFRIWETLKSSGSILQLGRPFRTSLGFARSSSFFCNRAPEHRPRYLRRSQQVRHTWNRKCYSSPVVVGVGESTRKTTSAKSMPLVSERVLFLFQE